jgi:hypothetical protein
MQEYFSDFSPPDLKYRWRVLRCTVSGGPASNPIFK